MDKKEQQLSQTIQLLGYPCQQDDEVKGSHQKEK